jgi:cysteine desulfurase/selenocysteine lyase
MPEVTLVGTAAKKSSVLSFLVKDIHPYDIGVLLNEQGIAIRTGHHCCQPLMERFQHRRHLQSIICLSTTQLKK